MGEVYLAFDSRLQRRVAIKLLPRSFTNDDGRVRRFIREAHAASALAKPIVGLYHQHNARVWGPYETEGRAVESLTMSVADIPADEAARALVRMIERVAAALG
jgi:serine/threonine-protein kinase